MAFGWGECIDATCDGVPEVIHGSRGDLFEEGLELGEGHLDRIEVGAVGRQEAQLCASALDGVTHGNRLVGGQVIHDDNVTWRECWHQHLLHIG